MTILKLFDDINNEIELAFRLSQTLPDNQKHAICHLIIAIAKLSIIVGLTIENGNKSE